ncbi:MAG: glycosyltransferase [Chloroflexi bacterium]|nr:glycosyltransferase [Chloroflexota bacterium]
MDFQVKQQEVMTRRDKAVYAALLLVYLASVFYYSLWWFQPRHLPLNWPNLGNLGLALDTLLFVSLSIVIWRGVLLNLYTYWAVSTMKVPVYEPPPSGLRVSMLTCFVPGKEPYSLLEKTQAAMTQDRYPNDTWDLDEGDDPVAKSMCRRLGVKHFSRKGIPEYNQPSGKYRTRIKGGNINAWVDRHGQEYDVAAEMDVDFVPRPEFLEKTLGYFRDPKVAFVGAPQIHGNQGKSWVARGAAEQVFLFYGPMQKGFYGKGMQMLIGGLHAFRIEAWLDIDGYSDSITEDHVTGMKVYARGWKSVYVPEILCVGEVPEDMLTYLGQQMRWAYGLTDILIKYTPRLLGKLSWTLRLGYPLLQTHYFFGLAQFIGIVLISLYLMFGITPAKMGFSDWLLHSAPPFFLNLVGFRWLQKFNIDPEREPVLGIRGIVLFFAAWPAFALGLYYAFIRQRLPYNITRKGPAGQSEASSPNLRILTPYLLSSVISSAGLVVSQVSGFAFPPIVFWAAFNLFAMIVVVFTIWQPTVPMPARLRLGSLRRAFPVSMATATTAIVVFGSINASAMLGVSPIGSQLILRSQAGKQQPVEARFLQPGSRGVAIGTVADSGDELEPISKISNVFINWQPDHLKLMAYEIDKAAASNKIAMITWQPTLLYAPEPNPSPTGPERAILRRIVAGEFDAYIADTASILRDTGQPVLVRFGHEMDIPDDGIHPWSQQQPELYIAAYRHVHDIFARKRADNVVWVWSPAGHWVDDRFISLDWYPGDKYVDMVGLTALIYWQWEEWNDQRKADHLYRSPEEKIGWAYDQVAPLGKPVVLAEVGVDLYPERDAEQQEWLRAMFELVKQDLYANIVAVVFFNSHAPFGWEADWRMSDEEMGLVLSTIESDEFFELSSSTNAGGRVN